MTTPVLVTDSKVGSILRDSALSDEVKDAFAIMFNYKSGRIWNDWPPDFDKYLVVILSELMAVGILEKRVAALRLEVAERDAEIKRLNERLDESRNGYRCFGEGVGKGTASKS